jgi:sarcosine oxidase subunit beta
MTVITADTVVIGAGILGAAIGCQLARRGQQVVIVERGASNQEGSAATAGNVHCQAIHRRRPGQEIPVDTARLLPLQRAARDRWGTLEEDLGVGVEFEQAGGFMVAETEDQHAELVLKATWEAAAGIPTEVIDGDTARAELPVLGTTVRAATWCPWDGYANPLLVTPAYLAEGGKHGMELYEHSKVMTITPGADTWLIEAGAHTFEAPSVVIAAGPWLAEMAALAKVPIQMSPVAIQMHETAPEAPVLGHLVQHVGEGLSVKQVKAGNLVIGGGWPSEPFDPTRPSRPLDASTVGNMALASRILPFLGERALSRTWAGPLAATPDEMPIIGAIPGAPGMFAAGGTYAFTFAPLWGDVVSALVLEEQTPVEVDDLSPARLMNQSTPAVSPRRS